jgi:hypothetical protein
MTTSIIPTLIDALVAQSDSAISSATVSDGYGVTEDPGDFLMIGVEDPDSADSSYSVDVSQAAATMGPNRSRDERGEIACVALSWNGKGNQKEARDKAFAITAKVEDLLRASPTLGISGYSLLVVQYGPTQRLRQDQPDYGAEAAVFFSVGFRARL